eukprot:350631-Chlamydomonas_euryale.AAC.6
MSNHTLTFSHSHVSTPLPHVFLHSPASCSVSTRKASKPVMRVTLWPRMHTALTATLGVWPFFTTTSAPRVMRQFVWHRRRKASLTDALGRTDGYISPFLTRP